MIFVVKVYVYKYCIFTMDWTSRISYVHIGQYYYYYNYSEFKHQNILKNDNDYLVDSDCLPQ